MRKILLLLMLLLVPTVASATSWAYPFVVHNDAIYIVTEEVVEEVDKKIGQVTYYSDMEQHGGNFSNHFPKGTAYYSIPNVAENEAIAVEQSTGSFVKATYEGPYEYNGGIVEKITDIVDPIEEQIVDVGNQYFKYIVIAIVIVVLILVMLTRRNDKNVK